MTQHLLLNTRPNPTIDPHHHQPNDTQLQSLQHGKSVRQLRIYWQKQAKDQAHILQCLLQCERGPNVHVSKSEGKPSACVSQQQPNVEVQQQLDSEGMDQLTFHALGPVRRKKVKNQAKMSANLDDKTMRDESPSTNAKSKITVDNSSNASGIQAGRLVEPINILTEHTFKNLAEQLPAVHKVFNWKRLFSARKNGSSLASMHRRIHGTHPLLLLVKEHKGNILGAYLSEDVRAGQSGTGETFVFCFRDGAEVPEIHDWKGGNQFFVYLGLEKGLGVGMGLGYGLYLDKNLEKGSSSATFTFGNSQPLSRKQDFYIQDVEVLGLSQCEL